MALHYIIDGKTQIEILKQYACIAGTFWPTDTTKNVVLGGSGNTSQKDLTMTPYLQLTEFEISLQGTDLTLKSV